MRSVAKNRSATSPTKNGETIAASAVVLYASPLSWPENWSVLSRYVPMVTYHAPQTKYWRNIITDSFNRVAVGICCSSQNGGRSGAHGPAGFYEPCLSSTLIFRLRKATSS